MLYWETFSAGTEAPSERQLLSWLVERLPTLFPAAWKVTDIVVEPEVATSPSTATKKRANLSFILADPTGQQQRIIVEAKPGLEPRDISNLTQYLEDFRSNDTRLLVVAPYISMQAAVLLRKSNINYLDATGNMCVQIERPALYIERQGATKNPWTHERTLQSLSGPAAGRVARALCDYRPPYGIRKLAAYAETLPGTVSKILSLLDREALTQRAARGKYSGEIVEVKWADLIRRWTQDYAFEASNSVSAYLEPRGLDALFRKLNDPAISLGRYGITGSFASVFYAPIVQPRLLAMYVDNRDAAATALGLRQAERGANVLLAEPFDQVVFSRTIQRDNVTYAAFSQVAADLLTGTGRGPQEGGALLQWMEEHEDVWRR